MRNPKRNLNEWMSLITECRQSGLSDAAWCEQNEISVSCFYNAVSRLRKKACNIPESARNTHVLDLTCSKQEVVKIDIDSDIAQTKNCSRISSETSAMYLDNSHTIEIATNGFAVRLSNSVNPALLSQILNTLRVPLC